MFVPGEEPHWLSDGGGEVGVSTTHRSTIEKGIGGGDVLYMENHS